MHDGQRPSRPHFGHPNADWNYIYLHSRNEVMAKAVAAAVKLHIPIDDDLVSGRNIRNAIEAGILAGFQEYDKQRGNK